MNGFVDNAGRALVEVELRTTHDALPRLILAWIDTGFKEISYSRRQLLTNLNYP
jgi:hypothetical protein